MNTDHGNKGIRNISIPGILIFKIVAIKFIAPARDETPAKCKLKIARSTAGPEWYWYEASGGYTVQPVPAPPSINAEDNNKIKEGTNNQKLKLFNRGNAISGAPIIKGTNQFPNPPINVGIIKKKIIIKAWAVTITLYNCQLLFKITEPVLLNSKRIIRENIVPIIPAKPPKIKYKVPISLWFVENTNRLTQFIIFCPTVMCILGLNTLRMNAKFSADNSPENNFALKFI